MGAGTAVMKAFMRKKSGDGGGPGLIESAMGEVKKPIDENTETIKKKKRRGRSMLLGGSQETAGKMRLLGR